MSVDAPSFQDIADLAVDELRDARNDLAVLEGDVTDAMTLAIAAAADAAVRQAVSEFASTFFGTSRGAALTKIIFDRLNLARPQAAPAIGELQFVRPESGGLEPAETFAAGHRVGTAIDADGNQVIVQLDSDVVFAPGDLGPKTGSATATVAGVLGNVSAGTLTKFVDQPSDLTFTVTNPLRFAGGTPTATDPQYLALARDFYSALRRATKAAIEFGLILDVPQIQVASAEETPTPTVFVSDQDGNSNQEMVNLAILALEDWRAFGVNVTAAGATLFSQDVDVSLTVKAGISIPPLIALIGLAVDGRLAKLKAGETLTRDMIQAAIIALDPDRIVKVTVNTPAADIVPAATQIIRAGTVTVS